MQFALLIYDDEASWANLTEEESKAIMDEWWSYTEELKKSGAYVAGEALQPIATAKSVRVRDGEQLVTDGPFAETKEQFGGFYLIDVESEEEAQKWAAKIPSTRTGTTEVRPLMVFDSEPAAAS
jgi:hypothetical protein